MGKPRTSSVLYRLIEAGQLTRKALLLPLREHGLQPGDDAVLLLLRDEGMVTRNDLRAALGLDPAALGERLERLSDLGLVDRDAALPRVVLSDAGQHICEDLTAHWSGLEDVLLAELDRKERKLLRKALGRLVSQLNP